jgi:hypothetical protein
MPTIPCERDVFGRRRVIERVPLAEKLGVGHLQFESVALKSGTTACRTAPAPCSGALFS